MHIEIKFVVSCLHRCCLSHSLSPYISLCVRVMLIFVCVYAFVCKCMRPPPRIYSKRILTHAQACTNTHAQ